jgi:hypothetical protein
MEIPQNQMDLLLAEVLTNHIEDVRHLLVSNGVAGAESMGSNDLKIAFLKAIKDSASFRDSASRFLSSLVQTQANNFTGAGNLNFGIGIYDDPTDPVPSDSNPTTTSATTPVVKPTTATGSFWSTLGGVANQDNLNKLFSTGLDTLSTTLKNKANKDSEERALELERIRLEQIQAQKDLVNAGGKVPGTTTSTGLSTGAKIGIGVGGAVLIGVVIYLVVRKK